MIKEINYKNSNYNFVFNVSKVDRWNVYLDVVCCNSDGVILPLIGGTESEMSNEMARYVYKELEKDGYIRPWFHFNKIRYPSAIIVEGE